LRQLFLATGGRKRPILLKKSRHNFGPRKSVVDVEIWFAQKTELSWFLRSNAKIQRFLIYRKAALSEADFFNKIGHNRTFTVRVLGKLIFVTLSRVWLSESRLQKNSGHPLQQGQL